MRNGKFLWIICVLFTLLFSLAACNSTTTDSNNEEANNTNETDHNETSDKNEESASATNTATINIGYSGPLSGPAAFYGKRTLNGVLMAAEEINDAGGFEVGGTKYMVNVVSLDDKYLPNETANNAKRLLQENKTPIIFTPHSGGIFALQVFNQQDKFIIGAYSSEPKITESGNTLTVRIPPRYDGYLEPFTTYTMEKFGKRIAFLPTASQYGKDWSEKLHPFWEGKGGEVVFNSSIDFAKETDFFTIVTNALKEKPDVLFIGGPSEPTAKVAMQARELGFEGGFIVMDQAKFDEMLRVTGSYDVLNGAIGVMPLVNSETAAIPAFVEKYKAEYGEDPGSEAGLNYIAMHAFVEAMKAAGTVEDVEAIHSHMQAGLDNLPEESRIYIIPSIGGDGGFEADLVVAAIEDGKVVPIEVD
ncbi:ABC transporter substrate-binding protein [Bacillus salitolerans]|uniref:ABC transporter substrate-binding protein n=1 Tax=Bacillus salitolerans TaxID=1437434 RepID=A0ABW4LSA9_9BACI